MRGRLENLFAMKTILTLFLALFVASVPVMAQQDADRETMPDSPESVARLDSLVASAMNIEDYKLALSLRTRQVDMLGRLNGTADSAYVSTYATLAPLHYRAGDLASAIAVADSAAAMYAVRVDSTDARYAFIVDNLGFYQASAEQYEAAEANARKALAVYEKFYRNDNDMAVILLHAAEACAGNGNAADAVAFELRGMNIIRQLYGEHSSNYTDEAEYLEAYYRLAGDDAKADELRSRVARLKAEAADGVMDIPSPAYVNTAERARWFNLQAAACATFLLRTAPADVERTNVCAFLWAWVAKSPDVNVTVGTVVAKAAQTPHGEMLMMAYAAAVIKDALARKDPTMTDEDYAEAAVQMVDYYNRNKDYFGKNGVMEDYAKLVRKGDFKKMFIEQGREDDKKEHVQIK